MTDKDWYCRDIHTGVDIKFQTGITRIAPCCLVPFTEYKGERFSELFADMRELNGQNKLDATKCRECIHTEQQNKTSRRQSVNALYDDKVYDVDGPEYIEVTLDNTCNSACMICGIQDSSYWTRYTDNKTVSKLTNDFSKVQELLSQFDLSNLKRVQFKGGEPFLSSRNEQFLNYLDERVDISEINLTYHSNGTVQPSENVIEMFSRFKLVEIYISLDDIGEAYEYQRFPTKWADIEKSIEQLYHTMPGNVMFKIEQTISLLNVHRLHKLEDWFNSSIIKTNKSGDPSYLVQHYAVSTFSLLKVSKDHLDWISCNPEALKHFGNITPKNSDTSISSFVIDQDKRRNMDINTWFPEFLSFYK